MKDLSNYRTPPCARYLATYSGIVVRNIHVGTPGLDTQITQVPVEAVSSRLAQ